MVMEKLLLEQQHAQSSGTVRRGQFVLLLTPDTVHRLVNWSLS